ncbi:MAG: hypothetical protein A2Y14_00135 [Verrucomicrobia bacterium GWF2_51_19]|nr:MAG: hypothetical protein A2Y14_00135 [Verrucomicrobia bacterium GWF2_51_19]
MKKLLLLVWALSASALSAEVILTVDLGEVYEQYYKAKIAQESFNTLVSNAQKEIQKMIQEGQELFKKLQENQEKLNNPGLSDDARKKLTEQLEKQAEELRKKEFDVNQFKQNTDFSLAQRRETIVKQHLDEIRKVVETIAKSKKADFVFNNEMLLYGNPSANITPDVIKKVNEGQPKPKDIKK